MSEITWSDLSFNERQMLHYLVLGNGAMVFDEEMLGICRQLEGMGLATSHIDGKWGSNEVDPTDEGRAVVKLGTVPLADEAPATAQPAPAHAAGEGVVDWNTHPEALAAQIVHAQMVLQDALGYQENDYNVSLTDLAEDIEALRAQLAATEARLQAAVGAAYIWKQAAKTHRKFGEQMAQRVEDAEQGWHDEVTSKYE